MDLRIDINLVKPLFIPLTSIVLSSPGDTGSPLARHQTRFPVANPVNDPKISTSVHIFGPTAQEVPNSMEYPLTLHRPMRWRYLICNFSASTRRLQFMIDTTEAFVLSGNKKSSFLLLPRSYILFDSYIIPWRIGWVMFPRCRVLIDEAPHGWREFFIDAPAGFILPPISLSEHHQTNANNEDHIVV